jgi:hypothetical protein
MPVLPDFDALGLSEAMMFEKAKPFNAQSGALSGGRAPEERTRARAMTAGGSEERFALRPARRAGEALRAVEWSELTARLNAARDLRLLLRTESQAPIESVAASFGDAAASYFALLDDSEPAVNPDALGQSKVLGAKVGFGEANRSGDTTGSHSDAPGGDARDKQ